ASFVIIGAITALISAMALCAAVIIALAEHVGPWQSALIVGLILGMTAGVIIYIGVSRFKRTSLKPERTIETLEENKEWLKEITCRGMGAGRPPIRAIVNEARMRSARTSPPAANQLRKPWTG